MNLKHLGHIISAPRVLSIITVNTKEYAKNHISDTLEWVTKGVKEKEQDLQMKKGGREKKGKRKLFRAYCWAGDLNW